ncbi:MAG: hypothetical protein ABIH00_11465 [Armatimonadota bacterium]
MRRKMRIFFKRRVKRFFAHLFDWFIDINKKYSKPQIEMRFSVKASLFILVFYLVFMMSLLIYKFVITVRG